MKESIRLLKKIAFVITLVFLCFSFSCQKQDVEADIAAINEIWNQYTVGCNTGDLDLWISLWTDNGIRMAPDAPAVFGKEQIREKMKSLFDQLIFKIAITNEEVRVAGDWAFSRGTYTLSSTPKAGGETIKVTGKYLTILERQADGSWKIARDCFNYNAPVQTESDETK